jgi:excisionase family DNA binding protein
MSTVNVSNLEWWTCREVGNRLGYDGSTIRRWCESGKIQAAKMPGGTWRIHASVVDSIGRTGVPDRQPLGREAPAEFRDAPDHFDDSPSPKARVRA